MGGGPCRESMFKCVGHELCVFGSEAVLGRHRSLGPFGSALRRWQIGDLVQKAVAQDNRLIGSEKRDARGFGHCRVTDPAAAMAAGRKLQCSLIDGWIFGWRSRRP